LPCGLARRHSEGQRGLLGRVLDEVEDLAPERSCPDCRCDWPPRAKVSRTFLRKHPLGKQNQKLTPRAPARTVEDEFGAKRQDRPVCDAYWKGRALGPSRVNCGFRKLPILGASQLRLKQFAVENAALKARISELERTPSRIEQLERVSVLNSSGAFFL
jgi:hypothetical protein